MFNPALLIPQDWLTCSMCMHAGVTTQSSHAVYTNTACIELHSPLLGSLSFSTCQKVFADVSDNILAPFLNLLLRK
jgi:hypothetical protein